MKPTKAPVALRYNWRTLDAMLIAHGWRRRHIHLLSDEELQSGREGWISYQSPDNALMCGFKTRPIDPHYPPFWWDYTHNHTGLDLASSKRLHTKKAFLAALATARLTASHDHMSSTVLQSRPLAAIPSPWPRGQQVGSPR